MTLGLPRRVRCAPVVQRSPIRGKQGKEPLCLRAGNNEDDRSADDRIRRKPLPWVDGTKGLADPKFLPEGAPLWRCWRAPGATSDCSRPRRRRADVDLTGASAGRHQT